MAVQSVVTNDYIQRSDSYLNTTLPFTIACWFLQNSSTPSGGTFRTIYNYGDPNGVDAFLYIGSDTATNNVVIGAFDGVTYRESAPQVPTSGTWEYVAMVYDGANALKFYVNGTLIDTIATNVAAYTFIEKSGEVGGSYMDFGWGYVGVWQAALTPTQLNTQAKSATPVTTALSFTPLTSPSDLTDDTGNGHGWTSHATLTQIADPWDGLVTQIAIEVLGDILAPEAVVTQISPEVLGTILFPAAIVTQIAVEILRPFACSSPPPPPPVTTGCVIGLGSGPATGGPGCAPSNL